MLELDALPDLPPAGAHLWGWFLDVHSTRQTHGMGPSRLSRLELRAWEEDEIGRRLTHWERRLLMAIDVAWVSITLDQHAKRDKKGTKP